MTSIAVIGGGKIGEALVAGLVAAGTPPETITVSNRRAERGEELREAYGIVDVTDNAQAVAGADTVFLCVKPKMIVDVLKEIGPTLDNNDEASTVVSMAAGIPIATMQEQLAVGSPVVRVMPNTPMTLRKGVCAVAVSRFVTEEQLGEVRSLLEAVGTVVVVEESDMDAVTAMSGSSPAYFFLVAEALVDAGVSLGLTRDTAQALVAGSVEGAGAMLRESGLDPVQLRANVSSPAGTTVAALRELEESGLRGAFYRAAEACADRSKELGQAAAPANPKVDGDE